jgi:hypothetical protein
MLTLLGPVNGQSVGFTNIASTSTITLDTKIVEMSPGSYSIGGLKTASNAEQIKSVTCPCEHDLPYAVNA